MSLATKDDINELQLQLSKFHVSMIKKIDNFIRLTIITGISTVVIMFVLIKYF